jgi:hypothetical protein
MTKVSEELVAKVLLALHQSGNESVRSLANKLGEKRGRIAAALEVLNALGLAGCATHYRFSALPEGRAKEVVAGATEQIKKVTAGVPAKSTSVRRL